MPRGILVWGVVLTSLSGSAWAQDGSTTALTATQQIGRRLFGQDCGVCHTRPTITSGLYGPALSKDLIKGNEGAMRDFISHGSDRMPGFQYYYQPDQIQAIVDYLDTVPAPAPVKPPSVGSAASGGGE